MSGNKLFLDTNIILYLLSGNAEIEGIIKGQEAVVSFITELELLSFQDIDDVEESVLTDLLKNCQIIQINQDIKRITIELKRKYRLKLPDAIIAATAFYLNLPLITADKMFGKIDEVDVILLEL